MEPTRTSRVGPDRRVTAIVTALLCAAMAWHLAERRDDERTLRAANEAGSAGHYRAALRLAATIKDGTAAADARFVEAQALLSLGDLPRSRRALESALKARPNDWRVRRDLAQVLYVVGDRNLARRQYARALALNPRMPRLALFDG